MTPPAYHLRTNKAIDRFMFIEAIRRLVRPNEISEYTYYGFGGPYLEDFRLLHEHFPAMQMVSIEKFEEIYKRQKFHLPTGKIKLRRTDLQSFLARYDPRDKRSIFWLDYTGLEYSQFEEFKLLLTKVTSGSVVKITLRATPNDFKSEQQQEVFRQKFAEVLPSTGVTPPRDFELFANLLQEMLQIASQQALPSGTGFAYQPISSFCYSDRAGILTLTGVVCAKNERKHIKAQFVGWPSANLFWAKPKHIDVPFLSTKERLHLQQHLPCVRDRGRSLIRVLGYRIDEDRTAALEQMKQYADFYLQYPYFMRAFP
jgi:hypothetical protein